MNTLKITKKDLDKDGFYIGKVDFSEYSKKYDGQIEIEGNLGSVRFKKGLHCAYSITASAGSGISAGRGISAGSGISAGWGISAGEGISAKLELSASYNIFAGVSRWKKAEGDDKKITCGKFVKGTIAYGDLVETGLPTEEKSLAGTEVTVTVGDKIYKAVIQ